MEGRGPDLDDSDAHTHAEDDAQVLLQPALHLLHAALRAENTATSPHDGRHHPDTQDHWGWGPPPARRSGGAGSGWSSNGPMMNTKMKVQMTSRGIKGRQEQLCKERLMEQWPR